MAQAVLNGLDTNVVTQELYGRGMPELMRGIAMSDMPSLNAVCAIQ